MKQKLVYLLTVCLLMLAACGDEAELTGARTPDNTLVLKPGEQEVNIRLGGITASGTVPASRSNDAVSLPGESRIDELVVYCFVDIDRDGQVVTTPLLNNYTLERKYHYKANAAENDLVLTADGDSYRISIPVPEDSHFRCFKIQVNMGDGSGATAVAVSEAIRSSATTAPGLPVSPLISADNDVITTPLPMSSDGYWEEELTGGYIQKNLRFSSGDLKKGMKASLVRQVSRFDINNPADTHFTVTSVTVSGVKPLPDNTTITDTKYSFTVSPANTAYRLLCACREWRKYVNSHHRSTGRDSNDCHNPVYRFIIYGKHPLCDKYHRPGREPERSHRDCPVEGCRRRDRRGIDGRTEYGSTCFRFKLH